MLVYQRVPPFNEPLKEKPVDFKTPKWISQSDPIGTSKATQELAPAPCKGSEARPWHRPLLWLVTLDKMDVSHNQCWRNSIRRWWSKIAVLSSLVLEKHQKHCNHFVLGRVAVNLNMYLGKGLGGSSRSTSKTLDVCDFNCHFCSCSIRNNTNHQLSWPIRLRLAIISEDDLGSHLQRLGSTSYPLTSDRMDSARERIDLELHCLHRFRGREQWEEHLESGRNGHGMFKWCWRGWIAW